MDVAKVAEYAPPTLIVPRMGYVRRTAAFPPARIKSAGVTDAEAVVEHVMKGLNAT